MSVKAILEQKGRDVATIGPGETLGAATELLAKHKIGALVVTKGDAKIAGILSERDIVRALAKNRGEALSKPVSSVMTSNVKICGEDNTVNEVMEIMTAGRFRHLPVETGGKLAGIISIGDVVKRRIEEVEREAEHIRSYIATG